MDGKNWFYCSAWWINTMLSLHGNFLVIVMYPVSIRYSTLRAQYNNPWPDTSDQQEAGENEGGPLLSLRKGRALPCWGPLWTRNLMENKAKRSAPKPRMLAILQGRLWERNVSDHIKSRLTRLTQRFALVWSSQSVMGYFRLFAWRTLKELWQINSLTGRVSGRGLPSPAGSSGWCCPGIAQGEKVAARSESAGGVWRWLMGRDEWIQALVWGQRRPGAICGGYTGILSAFRQSQTRLQLKGGVALPRGPRALCTGTAALRPGNEVPAGGSAPAASDPRGNHSGWMLN
jgi:hypothetical protein